MDKKTLTVANGAQNSSSVQAAGRSITRIKFPTTTGTTCTIQGSEDNSTFVTLGNENGAYSIASPSGRGVTLSPQMTWGWEYLRLVSGSAEGAERAIEVALSDYGT
jgi:hypothetical protein